MLHVRTGAIWVDRRRAEAFNAKKARWLLPPGVGRLEWLYYFKPSALWALAIGMLVLTGLNFPFPIHIIAARVAMPR